MTPVYQIRAEQRLVRLVYEGEASYPEWEAAMRAVLKHPDFRPGFAFLVDRRNVAPPSPEFVQRAADFIARHEAEFGGELKSATIVADQLSFGMERMIQGLCGSAHMHVFTSAREAEEWIDRGRAA